MDRPFGGGADRAVDLVGRVEQGLCPTRDVGTLRGMDVSRRAIDLKLDPAERRRLEDLVRNRNTPQKLVPRARIAPLSDGTRQNGAIARDVRVALPTVHRWQRRVQEQGVDGPLRDETRPSRIPAPASDVVERAWR